MVVIVPVVYLIGLGWAWRWVLRLSALLERRFGTHVPGWGGGGVVVVVVLLLLGGWRVLLPLQQRIAGSLQPWRSPIFVTLLLLGWLFWLGFVFGIGLGSWRTLAPKPQIAPFGYRRRR